MKNYEKYKDSEIEWIGEIPEHWSNVSLKWVSEIYSGGTPSKKKPGYWSDGTIPWLNSGTVNQGDITEASEYITEEALANSSAKWFPEKAILIALAGQGKTKGMVAQTQFKATCNQSLGIIVPNYPELNRFLLYWLRKNYQNIRNLGGGDKRDGINLEMIGSIPIPLPTKEEQTAIANYLDKKTAEIDQLISEKEQLVALYQEEKTAIINQAVTKGINPNIKLKDSGIEWLGVIPEHWEVLPIKYTLSTPITDGPHETPELVPDGIPFISAEAIKNDRIDFKKKRGFITQEEHERFSLKYKPQIGDVYMIKSGATTGNLAIVETDREFNIWSPLAAMRPKKDELLSKFLFFFMKSKSFFSAIELGWNYGTQQNIGMKVLENIRMVLPKMVEQTQIVEHIEKESTRIDSKIARVEKYITLLTEYRTALISEVVTGKIKVID